ncbi:MAG: glycosyltransferase [Jiangellaceae bacterium]
MPTDPIVTPDHRDGAPSVYDDPGFGANSALDAFAEPNEPLPVDPAALAAHHVTAVLVAHDGQRWLPGTLAAIAASDRPPDRLLAVDTGSRDASAQLLADALGGHAVVSMPASTGFGAAVQAGLKAADDHSPIHSTRYDLVEWVWLLHDDCAPAPDALRRLLEYAVLHPETAVIGPKVRGWRDERQLLEVGVSMTGGGRRHTGLERREYDQGQHDASREVLAVGSAGMLVRRDVWDELGGFDPKLPIFRDDVDFGWRANLAGHPVVVHPDAVVQHAEAAAHGRRRLGATRDRAHLVDRRNALYVLLANAPASRVPFVFLRVMLGGIGRALGFLFGKQPALAAEELLAVLAVVGRPDRLFMARRRRARTRRVAQDELRRFFPPPGQQVRHAGETVLALVSGTGSGYDLPGRSRAATGSDDDDDPVETESIVLRALLRPPVLLLGGLVLLTLVAARGLVGGGRLTGGALLPAPDAAADLWATYTQSWHGVGLGSPTPAPPYLAVVGLLGTLVRSPSLAVDLLLVASVPLAGFTSYLLIRRVVESRWLRVWVAATYALFPATTGAIAAGRLGTAVAAVLTPVVVLAAARTLGSPGHHGPFRAAWSAGLLLAVTAAFVPLAWIIAVVVGVIGIVTVYRDRGSVLRILAALAVTPIVLIPWTAQVAREPVLLVTEAGMPGPDLSDSALAPWAILLQHPGGPGAAPVLLGVGVVLAGWAALFRKDRRVLVLAGWALAATALVAGLVVSRLPVTGPTLETPVAGWPGYPAVLVGGGLLVAGAVGAERARQRLSGASFGWRQPLAVIVAVLAAAAPIVGAGWWLVRGADDPLDRRDPTVLPTYVADEGARPERVRTLVLSRADDGPVTYALLRRAGPRLGDAETGPPPEDYAALDRVVGDLVSDRGGADATALAPFAARYVYLPAPADPGLVDVLDTVPGLTRASAPEGAVIWQVSGAIARVRVLGGESGPVVVPSEDVDAAGVIPPGPEDRQLVMAELADSGWSATFAGRELDPTTVDGWAQAFTLSADGGEVEITHRNAERSAWLTAQLVAVLVAVVLALPAMRRERGSVDDAAEFDPDEPVSPDLPTRPIRVGAPAEELVVVGPAVTSTKARRRHASAPYPPPDDGPVQPSGAEMPPPTEPPQDAPYVGRRAAPRGGVGKRPGGHRAKGRRKRDGGDS